MPLRFAKMCISLIIISSALSSVSYAEVDAGTFLQHRDTSKVDRWVYDGVLSAMESGFGWSNAALRHEHQRPLYCVPEKLVFTDQQLVDIMRRDLAEYPHHAAMPYGLVLLTALQKLFPCP